MNKKILVIAVSCLSVMPVFAYAQTPAASDEEVPKDAKVLMTFKPESAPFKEISISAPSKAVQKDAAHGNIADLSHVADALDNAFRQEKFTVHGNFRTLYVDASVNAPGVKTYKKVATVNRRLQLYPSLQVSKEWKLTGMLEDTRYDREIGRDHADDNHLYLDRLYASHEADGSRLTIGRDNLWPIEGNVFDLIVEGIRYEYGDAAKNGHLDFFAGRTVGKSSRLSKDRKNGVVASYLKKWPSKLATGFYFYGLHRDDDSLSVPTDASSFLKLQRTVDNQQLGELYLKYPFDKNISLELEGLYGHASTKLDDWQDTRTGYIATLRLHQQPFDMFKVGDYGLWASYYNLPRPAYVYPTIDPDVTIFGRDGFKGFGARFDYVVSRGLLFQTMYYDIKNHDSNISFAGLNPFKGEKERLLGMTLRQFF